MSSFLHFQLLVIYFEEWAAVGILITRYSCFHFSYYFEGQVTTVCNMDFKNYPLDSQKCTILIGSISQQIDVVMFDAELTFTQKTQRTLQYSVRLENTHLVCKGKYHCMGELLSDLFGFSSFAYIEINNIIYLFGGIQTGQIWSPVYNDAAP